jgi:hypothetical protein
VGQKGWVKSVVKEWGFWDKEWVIFEREGWWFCGRLLRERKAGKGIWKGIAWPKLFSRTNLVLWSKRNFLYSLFLSSSSLTTSRRFSSLLGQYVLI